MSDIQEEQKRLYKRAEENDNIFLQDKIEKYKESNKEYIELNKELYYRINKAIEIIKKHKDYKDEGLLVEETIKLLDILEGSDNNE